MSEIHSYSGTVTEISDFSVSGRHSKCDTYKLITIKSANDEPIGFVITPETYFVNNIAVRKGDYITGFYDADAPVALIYPPQYQAIVISKSMRNFNVKAAHFDENLVSSDGNLKINPSPMTKIMLINGKPFRGSIADRDLIVIYGASTKSIPAQTVPYKIIIMS